MEQGDEEIVPERRMDGPTSSSSFTNKSVRKSFSLSFELSGGDVKPSKRRSNALGGLL